ncbi:MAG TPA: TIGR03619 family F420-dependent LLM class oxidoreductase [Candidatus Limnocylindria bacterium]|nr:TIGR03619 family F420-dependent LLM class oxidoreductase [Candidatus Limnocylindria bacterium]
MKFGLFGINIGACAEPELQRRVLLAAEAAGFESVWTGEHVAMPIRDNPVPAPPETPFLDSIVTLTRAAALTERLRLGTGILVLPHHNPVVLAKALASLDVVSGGRLIAGFAGGYVEAEFRALGVDFHRRGAITDDSLAAIRALWTEAEPRYAGRFARFEGIRFEPKPVTRPHPPIVIGGQAPAALARAARHGDGWYGFALTVERCGEIVTELRRLRAATPRAPEPLEISLTTFEPLTAELVEQAERAGIDRLIVYPLVAGGELERTVRELGARFVRR